MELVDRPRNGRRYAENSRDARVRHSRSARRSSSPLLAQIVVAPRTVLHYLMTPDEVAALKVTDLKAELAGRGAHGDAVVRGRQDAAVSSVLDDHAYMTRARYLIIDQASTFAFWAACFSDAEQVHLPTPGMPLVTWAKSSLTRNFTFHSLV